MSSEPKIANVPAKWMQAIERLAGRVTLDVAGHETTLQITPAQLEQVYLPILATLHELSRTGRVMAALAGVPGSGKSTVVATLAHLADKLLGPGVFVSVAMDGWHFPNAVLDSRTIRNTAGRTMLLRQRKGAPESFDAHSMADALRKVKQADTPMRLPIYDRKIHEPVADAVIVEPKARIILVEGNYLLLSTPPWDRVSKLLYPRFYLHCSPVVAGERVMARHVRGGNNRSQAQERYHDNDSLNIELVAQHAGNCDWIIQMEPQPNLRHCGQA